uniref:DUF4258 domain-containing protein n=1 Tax=Heterorhabditis bacteriophora TaxID=37862 RepID=A0A1I7WZD8_HETBA
MIVQSREQSITNRIKYLLEYSVNDTEDYIRQEGQRLKTPATTPITPSRAFYRATEISDTEDMRIFVTVVKYHKEMLEPFYETITEDHELRVGYTR